MSHSTPDVAVLIVRGRNAVMTVFAANGLIAASFLSRLPDVKSQLSITSTTLSFLLLAIACGSLIGLPLAGRIADRLGPSATVRAGALIALAGMSAAAVSIQFAQILVLPAIGLLCFGFGVGVWDVAQNLEGSLVEQKLGRAIMPWFHAAFSGGTVLGALLGAVATHLELPVGVHVSAAAVACGVAVIGATARFLAAAAETPHETDAKPAGRSAWTEPRTLLVGLMVLAAAFTEGTANDWTALAFVEGHGTTTAQGVLGLAVFMSFMTLGRILGTRALDTYGRIVVLRTLFAAAIVGCALVVFGGTFGAYVGAAIWGIGASLGFPVGMSAAADDPQRAAARISVVATLGYVAFLAGPPLIGFLGDSIGILRALLAVGVVGAAALLAVPAAKPLK